MIKKVLDWIAGVLVALGILCIAIPFGTLLISELVFFGSFGKIPMMDWGMDWLFNYGTEGFPLFFMFISWAIVLFILSGLVHLIEVLIPKWRTVS